MAYCILKIFHVIEESDDGTSYGGKVYLHSVTDLLVFWLTCRKLNIIVLRQKYLNIKYKYILYRYYLVYLHKKHIQYDKGFACSFHSQPQELLLWQCQCHLQGVYYRGHRLLCGLSPAPAYRGWEPLSQRKGADCEKSPEKMRKG